MKTITCRQLAGACDLEFHANTFSEIAKMSKAHAMKMVQNGDEAHKAKMNEMMTMTPQAQKEWFEKVQKEFNALPEDK